MGPASRLVVGENRRGERHVNFPRGIADAAVDFLCGRICRRVRRLDHVPVLRHAVRQVVLQNSGLLGCLCRLRPPMDLRHDPDDRLARVPLPRLMGRVPVRDLAPLLADGDDDPHLLHRFLRDLH